MTVFHTEKINDDNFHQFDPDLLRFSNYLYNNLNGDIQSPHFERILNDVKKIDSDGRFLKITDRFRPLASRSPALSGISLQIKQALLDIMNDSEYQAEIVQDSVAIIAQSQHSSFSMADYEREYEQSQASKMDLSNDDLLWDMSEKGHTDEESVLSASDADLFHVDEKIIHGSLEDIFNPSKDTQHKAIRLLIRYIQDYKATPAAERSAEATYIITSVKLLCPGVLSKITPHVVEDDFINKLKKADMDNLYTIAGSSARELNAFHDRSRSSSRVSSRSLDPEILQIKVLTDYLNYALLRHMPGESDVSISTTRAKYLMHMTQKISPQLKKIITDVHYPHKIEDMLTTLSDKEKTELISLATRNGEELSKTKALFSEPSSPGSESETSSQKKFG